MTPPFNSAWSMALWTASKTGIGLHGFPQIAATNTESGHGVPFNLGAQKNSITAGAFCRCRLTGLAGGPGVLASAATDCRDAWLMMMLAKAARLWGSSHRRRRSLGGRKRGGEWREGSSFAAPRFGAVSFAAIRASSSSRSAASAASMARSTARSRRPITRWASFCGRSMGRVGTHTRQITAGLFLCVNLRVEKTRNPRVLRGF